MNINNFNFVVGSFESVVNQILEKITEKKSIIVLPCSLNDLSAAWRKSSVLALYQKVDIFTADGVPLVWFNRWKTGRPVERVYGPDLLKAVLFKTQGSKHRHFFIGADSKTLSLFQKKVRELTPRLHIVGKISLNNNNHANPTISTDHRIAERINKNKPSILWIGIGSPKQVELAVKWKQSLPWVAIFCVGAAIELIAGLKPSAPSWMQKSGLEWFFRLISEPRRLWKRYLVDIPLFLSSTTLDILRGRLSPMRHRQIQV